MSTTLTLGPTHSSPVAAAWSLSVPAFVKADYGVVEDSPGTFKLRDLTSPRDQEWTIRVAQKPRANVYAGSSIDPAKYLSSRSGIDTLVELLGTAVEVDSVSGAEEYVPVRFALSMTVPDASVITAANVKTMLAHLLGGLGAFDATGWSDSGLTGLLNGVVHKA